MTDFWGALSSCCWAGREKRDHYADSSYRSECGPLVIRDPWMSLEFCEFREMTTQYFNVWTCLNFSGEFIAFSIFSDVFINPERLMTWACIPLYTFVCPNPTHFQNQMSLFTNPP